MCSVCSSWLINVYRQIDCELLPDVSVMNLWEKNVCCINPMMHCQWQSLQSYVQTYLNIFYIVLMVLDNNFISIVFFSLFIIHAFFCLVFLMKMKCMWCLFVMYIRSYEFLGLCLRICWYLFYIIKWKISGKVYCDCCVLHLQMRAWKILL